jgi:hypothetical protein
LSFRTRKSFARGRQIHSIHSSCPYSSMTTFRYIRKIKCQQPSVSFKSPLPAHPSPKKTTLHRLEHCLTSKQTLQRPFVATLHSQKKKKSKHDVTYPEGSELSPFVARVNFFHLAVWLSSPLLLSNLRRLVASRHGAMQGKCETIKGLEGRRE